MTDKGAVTLSKVLLVNKTLQTLRLRERSITMPGLRGRLHGHLFTTLSLVKKILIR